MKNGLVVKKPSIPRNSDRRPPPLSPAIPSRNKLLALSFAKKLFPSKKKLS